MKKWLINGKISKTESSLEAIDLTNKVIYRYNINGKIQLKLENADKDILPAESYQQKRYQGPKVVLE